MEMWNAGADVDQKEDPVHFVVVIHAAERDGRMAPDALAPTAAVAIIAVWKNLRGENKRENHTHFWQEVTA